MSREKRIYMIVGKVMCDIVGVSLIMGLPIVACYLVGLISHIVLGG